MIEGTKYFFYDPAVEYQRELEKSDEENEVLRGVLQAIWSALPASGYPEPTEAKNALTVVTRILAATQGQWR